MEISNLSKRPEIENDPKLKKAYMQYENLLQALKDRDIPDQLVAAINEKIESINSSPAFGKELRRLINKTQTNLLKLIEKELKIVPKNYYQKLWTGMGMAAFGLPIGVAMGTALGNMAFIGIGLPIGLAIGAGIGAKMDKKAFEEGRQLDVAIEL